MLDAVDFTGVPSLRLVLPVVGSDPAGYEAGVIYNSTTKEFKYHNGTAWVALGPAGAGGPPSGAAGGDLSGTYPNPGVVRAAKWTTARSITLTGDVTGSAASVDGSANVSIATTAVNVGAKHFAGVVGAGTTVVVNHALNTRDVVVEVYRATTPWDTVQCTVERTDLNNVTLKFATAVGASAYRCVVTGR
jgi:hypothetical protein